MSNSQPTEEPLIPRLLASNALRANLSKHMDLNKMADSKASAGPTRWSICWSSRRIKSSLAS